MPKRLFHVVLLTDELEETVRFLSEVVGMGEPQWHDQPGEANAIVFGWPAEGTDTKRVVLGEGPGLIEVVGIPEPMRGTVEPGAAFLAFATPDPDGLGEAARAAGFEPGERYEMLGATLVPITVGGLPFEFVRF
jgi:catechol 2,3-dioxygenase-like lactoylglutathione lyase family enzyme